MTDQVSITPWPVSDRFRRVILVGGTFDPPHSAHVRMVEALRASRFPDAAIVFIPAAVSPFKTGRPGTDPTLRARMIALAATKIAHGGVWTDEIDRARAGEPSYMIETLRRLRIVAPNVMPILVIGSDQAAAFHRWREPREILRLAEVVVLPREPIGGSSAFREALTSVRYWDPTEVESWVHAMADVPADPVSSTRIRERIAEEGVDAIDPRDVDPEVAAFIRANHLYASE